MKNTAILLIDCPDRKGLVATVADFLYKNDANIRPAAAGGLRVEIPSLSG